MFGLPSDRILMGLFVNYQKVQTLFPNVNVDSTYLAYVS